MPRYAVIFRTHFWDDFTRRQLVRLQSRVRTGDIHVVLDETGGPVTGIDHPRVTRITETQLLAMGLAQAGAGNLLWFNGDYPLYRFQQLHPGYDYYLQLEYDAVLDADIDALVARAAAEQIDFIALDQPEPATTWYWGASCQGVYDPDEIAHALICVSLYSARALTLLHRRRLALSAQWQAGQLSVWPYCEAFVPTELARGGLRRACLSAFGDTRQYDHWPPLLEGDLPQAAPAAQFMHPVLDAPRYASSLLKYRIGLGGYLNPASRFHRCARRLPFRAYVALVANSFAAKARRTLTSNRTSPMQAAR